MVRITGVEGANPSADEGLTLGRAERMAEAAGVTNIRYSPRSTEERWALTRVSAEGKIERHVARAGRLALTLNDLMIVATKELIA